MCCFSTLAQILTVVVIAAVVALSAVSVTARRVKKPIEQIAHAFRDFAGEDDIDLIINDDNRPPTNYVGDVMKAQTTSIKQLTGSKKFNYKYVQDAHFNIVSYLHTELICLRKTESLFHFHLIALLNPQL